MGGHRSWFHLGDPDVLVQERGRVGEKNKVTWTNRTGCQRTSWFGGEI